MLNNILKIIKKNNNSEFMGIKTDIIVFFSANQKKLYQLYSWLTVLEELNKSHHIVIIANNIKVFKEIKLKTSLKVVYIEKDISKILKFYTQSEVKLIFYLNNNIENFKSLIYNKAFHIHIGHGDSDKISSVSNQFKSYDYVFVSAKIAINRIKNNLINFQDNKFIQIGRPQLEYIESIKINSDKKIILYAPTWEGNLETMAYSSIKKFGLDIIDILIKNDYFILYKPHPYIGSSKKEYKIIHNKIIDKLEKYEYAKVILNENIVNLYKNIDLGIFDNSAALIDYLAFNKPYIITNIINVSNQESIKGGEIIDQDNLYELADIIKKNLENDYKKEIRNKIKSYYLGDFNYEMGESTSLLNKKINELINIRNSEVSRLI